MMNWNPVNLPGENSLTNTLTKECLLFKKRNKKDKMLQLTEESMNQISKAQLAQDKNFDEVFTSLEEISKI